MPEVSDLFAPKPAFQNVPEWYKKTEPYINNEEIAINKKNALKNPTIKKCMPVFDMIASGYLLFTTTDVFVDQEKGPRGTTQPVYHWPSWDCINFHVIDQAPELPYNSGHTINYPKWINPWSIKTPPGYSVLIIQPTYRDSVFTILPGVVDTDKYFNNINFPFVLNDINFEGLIPAGTPMAQVIPFKRESWQREFGNDQQIFDSVNHAKNISSVFHNGYKKIFRQDKTYK